MKNMKFNLENLQPQPEEEFQNPIFNSYKIFAKYCAIYDPMVSIKSAKVVEPRYDFSEYRSWLSVTLEILGEKRIENINYYYSCYTPFRELNQKAKIVRIFEKIIEQYQIRKENQSETFDKLFKTLNTTLLLKQYVFYTLESGKNGWAVILRGQHMSYEPENSLIGLGKTLPEADLDFVNQRIRLFKRKSTKINQILELDIPITKEEMLDVCSQIDDSVKPESITSRFKKYDGGFLEQASIDFFCKSKTRQFLLELNWGKPHWKVTRYIDVDSTIISRLPVEGEGKTLKEAYDESESKYQSLKTDPEAFNEAVTELERMEYEAILEYTVREGEAHINSLLSEYGEDVFPDRG
jgi:hypothetical protein